MALNRVLLFEPLEIAASVYQKPRKGYWVYVDAEPNHMKIAVVAPAQAGVYVGGFPLSRE
jgi:hypothetical protein